MLTVYHTVILELVADTANHNSQNFLLVYFMSMQQCMMHCRPKVGLIGINELEAGASIDMSSVSKSQP